MIVTKNACNLRFSVSDLTLEDIKDIGVALGAHAVTFMSGKNELDKCTGTRFQQADNYDKIAKKLNGMAVEIFKNVSIVD